MHLLVFQSAGVVSEAVFPDQMGGSPSQPHLLPFSVRQITLPFESTLLGYLPAYPQWVWPKPPLPMGVREGASFAAALEPLWSMLAWDPRMPAWLPRRYPFHPAFFEGVSGELIAIGARMAWNYKPDPWIARHPPLVPGEIFWTIPPFVPAGGERCVELIDTAFTTTTMLAQDFSLPGIITVTLSRSTLVSEAICAD